VERYDVRRQLAPLAGRHVFVAAGTDDAVVPLAGLRALGGEMRTSGIALT
jgi:predicted esterase